MGGEWIHTTIGQQVTLQRGFDITKVKQRKGPVPVISSSGISSYHDIPAVRGPGVILGRKGVVGSVYFVPADYWPHDTTLWVKDFHGNDPRFVYYFFKWLAPRVAAMDVGSANPTLNRNHVHPIEAAWPPVPEQQAIAHILGTLDDKIELNRRMSQTLEAIARALFKSWFVDFDPVRAKAKGRDPGLPRHIADLFPDSFEESELGKIPRGWRVARLGDIIDLAYGKALKEDARRPGRIRVFGSNGQVGWHSEKLVEGPGIVVGRKGNPGVVTWAPGDFFPIDTTFYVVPKSNVVSLRFLYYALLYQNLASLGADSAVPGLNRNLAYLNQLLVPSPAALEAFDEHIRRVFEKRACLEEEAETLAALRDALLPRLISGELRVKDAERFVEEATS